MSFECPACKRPIANRRKDICAYCGAILPNELLFTPEEIARLDKLEREEEARRVERKRQKEGDTARLPYSGTDFI